MAIKVIVSEMHWLIVVLGWREETPIRRSHSEHSESFIRFSHCSTNCLIDEVGCFRLLLTITNCITDSKMQDESCCEPEKKTKLLMISWIWKKYGNLLR